MLSIIATILSIVISVFRIVKYILTKLKKLLVILLKINFCFYLRVRKKHRWRGAFP